MEKNLLQSITDYAGEGWMPFHMPGHKRAPLGGGLPWQLDITETAGFDDLKDPRGILRDLTRRAAARWSADEAWIGVNGSTGAILAGIRAMTKRGDTVLAARNCHVSVFHAMELCALRPVFLEPEWLPAWGVYGALSQRTLDNALRTHPEAALCIVTSPTYEGILSPLECPIPLFADAAHGAAIVTGNHGAHLPLPRADLAAVSLHKTLPALTQTALLLSCGPRVDREKVSREMRVFQTSSPSYVLLASVAHCLALLEEHREDWFAAWERRLDAFYAHARRWRGLRLFNAENHDRGKLLIHCDAEHAAAHLRHLKIEPEYARGNLLLLMTSCCDTDEAMARLTAALDALDAHCPPAPPPAPRPAPLPEGFLDDPSRWAVEYPPGVPTQNLS
ncbi:MAG: hypothetical protein FWE98_02530 [Oscillospiraceae bacterium]|nr:hypothetical protein [Oscillospiraceae bacterium]